MTHRLLIIGNTSETYHVGSMFARAAAALDVLVTTNDINWRTYAPSMQYLWGRGFYKLAGKRALEWWSFNQKTASHIREFQPTLVLVTGIFPLTEDIFHATTSVGAKICNFLTDDPWARRLRLPRFFENLSRYDLIFSTKSRIVPNLLSHGANRVEFLFYAFDPYWHRLPDPVLDSEKEGFTADISFVGTGALERLPALEAIASLGNLNLKLYGNDWNNISIKGWRKNPSVSDNEFRLAIHSSKLSLCLLRKSSRDDSTQRTFEIAPCGGCGIYEDTPEHREVLQDYPEYGFFSSPTDLAAKCKWLLENSEKREQMRQLGIAQIVQESNTYTARLKTILEMVLS